MKIKGWLSNSNKLKSPKSHQRTDIRSYLAIQLLIANANRPVPISQLTVTQLKTADKIVENGTTTYVNGVSKPKTDYARGNSDIYMNAQLYKEIIYPPNI